MVITSILPIRKLSRREGNELAQGHTMAGSGTGTRFWFHAGGTFQSVHPSVPGT